MKTISFVLGALLLTASLAAATGSRTFTGVIGDSMCVRDHAAMKIDPQDKCVRDCVKHSADGKYILLTKDKHYILSDQAAMLTGSIGMLPSASLDANNKGLYEPVHGSAPDIAGKGIANPIAMIASFGMALRYSFNLGKQADWIDQAISATLAKGLRTADIKSEGTKVVSTSEMGSAILAELEQLAA